MRVLIVGPSPDKSKGGMATVIKEIRNDAKLREKCNIDIYPSYIDGNKIKVALYSLFSYIRFVFTKNGYDIYHIHAASYGSIFRKGWYVKKAKEWGKKAILHIHGAKFMEFYAQLPKHKKTKVKEILHSADMVIALSETWKQKFGLTFGLNNCVVLENGIDMDKLAPALTDPKNNQKAFLMLGRLGQRKGTYDLIDAINIARESVPDIMCYLAGDGEIDNVTKVIHEKNLEKNIEVVGWADDKKKIELLGKVSTVVLPSYNEGLPMAVLEGMACGKAIISTTVGAIPEVVKLENGFLVEPGDIDALVAAMIICANDSEIVREMGLNNIEEIRRFYSMEIMHRKLNELYIKVNNESRA